MDDNKCRICGSDTFILFQTKVLFKYDVNFHKCPKCSFMQTDYPYWIDEAYEIAIPAVDTGLMRRNLLYSTATENILKTSFDYNSKFLDFAGGFGMFVRLMRDKGFDFFWDDKYCENIFAQHFTLEDLPKGTKFEAVTSFEVFEHVPDPIQEIEKLFEYSDTIIFSTELIPNKEIKSEKDWWYLTVDSGKHVSFYTKDAFNVICEKFSCNFYTNGHDLHILTKKKLNKNPLIHERTTWDKVIDKLVRILSNTKTKNVPDVHLVSKLHSDYLYLRGLEKEKNSSQT